MNNEDQAWAAMERLYKDNDKGLRELARAEDQERDWRRYVTLIGFAIENTIPNNCEIETLDAVKLLLRENNALRKAVGLPTYAEMARSEDY